MSDSKFSNKQKKTISGMIKKGTKTNIRIKSGKNKPKKENKDDRV